MKKCLLLITCLILFSCKKNKTEQMLSITTIIEDTLKMESSKNEEIEGKKNILNLDAFTDIPAKYSNDSDANAYLYTDEIQMEKNGEKYGVCDFINNLAYLKINGKFETLKDTSGTESYLENKIYENSRYRLEFDLNKPVTESLQNKILNQVETDGAYVLKGTIKLIEIKSQQNVTKETYVFGM